MGQKGVSLTILSQVLLGGVWRERFNLDRYKWKMKTFENIKEREGMRCLSRYAGPLPLGRGPEFPSLSLSL